MACCHRRSYRQREANTNIWEQRDSYWPEGRHYFHSALGGGINININIPYWGPAGLSCQQTKESPSSKLTKMVPLTQGVTHFKNNNQYEQVLKVQDLGGYTGRNGIQKYNNRNMFSLVYNNQRIRTVMFL